jgi:hypothetical protein
LDSKKQDAASESNDVVVADENEKKNSIKITKKEASSFN